MRFGRARELDDHGEAEAALGSSATELRQLGDNYRDRGLWAEAARHYRRYLEDEAEDAAIWVQLGHCLKESGAFREAEAAYDRAVALTPDDDDVFLHRGHLAKLMGSTSDAVYFYKRSLGLRPEGNDALKELLALGALDTISEVLPSFAQDTGTELSTIWLDITDLVVYAEKNPSLSGIQRVVANLVKHSTGEFSDGAPIRVRLVIPEFDRSRIFAVSTFLVSGMVELLENPGSDRAILDAAIKAVYASRELVDPAAGDLFVIAGAFWIYDHYDMIAALRARGVAFGLFIHDLIQLKNPEYVHEEATLVFRKSLIDVLMLANFVLTNSEYVAGEVREFLDKRLGISLPVKAIPLATELHAPAKRGARIDPEIVEVARDEFVLCVCTIEVRKNHLYLVRIWERLVKEFGSSVPKLVFVGKWGWDIAPFQEFLAKTDALGNWLHVFNGISDGELEYLYRRCLFTVFASFAEGWGLPVGESLAYGKPCVASNATSIPEVGGALVRYVDPFDLRAGYEAVRQLLADREELVRWTQEVRDKFRPKSWRTFCGEFYDAVREFSGNCDGGALPNNCLLPSGELLFVGDDDVDRLDAGGGRLVTLRMARAAGWHPVEHWGVWAAQRRARLKFRTNLAEGEAIKLYLRLQAPPVSEGVKCAVRAGAGAVATLDSLTAHATFYQAGGRIGENGILEITLAFGGTFGKPDHRDLYLGISALGFCKTSDPLARIDLLEKVTLCQITHPSYVPPQEPTPQLTMAIGSSVS